MCCSRRRREKLPIWARVPREAGSSRCPRPTEGTRWPKTLRGQVTKVVLFGVFVQVAEGIEGLVLLRELTRVSVGTPSAVLQVGDEVMVVVTEIHRQRRRPALSRREGSPDLR
ncbi:S1 RNA-binding domain-containing protein [Streptomyces fagopyri]|uniref:S1 RNA-binding domain-containing protein n=1 Tax=Streptomyces fagopyri TaxID=2662397 RepID=UPI001D1791C1|nr:S1 RNA-binding domain-containing protein [Streptomyces fagopyri]